KTEETMTGTAAETMRHIDWEALAARVQKLGNYYQTAIWRSVIGLLIVVPLVVLYTMPADVQPFGWVLGAVLGVFVVGKTTLERRRWIKDARTAAVTQGDTLTFWRKDLERRITVSRLGPLEALAGLCLLTPLALLPWSKQHLTLAQWTMTL